MRNRRKSRRDQERIREWQFTLFTFCMVPLPLAVGYGIMYLIVR